VRKSRFTEEQIIALPKEAEAGRRVADLCREHGISENTLYRWKSKYRGLEVSTPAQTEAGSSGTAPGDPVWRRGPTNGGRWILHPTPLPMDRRFGP